MLIVYTANYLYYTCRKTAVTHAGYFSLYRIYFKTVLKDESAIAAGKLLPVILERVTIILSIEGYKKNVQK